jgi:tRNA pseudouridine55 synthase
MSLSYLLLNKSAGVTSFQALAPVKSALRSTKVGHTGTLDKFAHGLLFILIGGTLKLTSYITGLDKKYDASIYFGGETTTLDPEGEVVASAPVPTLSELEAVLPGFTGKIMQKPPEYSAIHVGGKRAHELARAGERVDLPAREISIYSLELLDYSPPYAKIRVHCSSGTYVRSLARDIARAAASRAHLNGLVRTALGPFSLEEARPTETAEEIKAALRPVDAAFFNKLRIPVFQTDVKGEDDIRYGRLEQFFLRSTQENNVFASQAERVAVLHDDEFLSILLRKDESHWSFGFVVSQKYGKYNI